MAGQLPNAASSSASYLRPYATADDLDIHQETPDPHPDLLFLGGRSWFRTSDPSLVRRVLYH